MRFQIYDVFSDELNFTTDGGMTIINSYTLLNKKIPYIAVYGLQLPERNFQLFCNELSKFVNYCNMYSTLIDKDV